jgi:hypothetical protein
MVVMEKLAVVVNIRMVRVFRVRVVVVVGVLVREVAVRQVIVKVGVVIYVVLEVDVTRNVPVVPLVRVIPVGSVAVGIPMLGVIMREVAVIEVLDIV